MKSFLTGTAIAIVVAIVAGVVLTNMNQTTGEKYSTANVRLH